MNRNNSSGIWDSKECVLILIDFQPGVMSYIRSSDPKLVELNGRYLAKAALAFDIPIILSTVGVKLGANQPTIESLRNEIPDVPEIDRSSMDSWGDKGFVEAVEKTGRKRLVMCGILTEVCLAYPVVNALKEDYEVCFIADASGGASKEAHDMAVLRMIQAGAVPNTASAMIAEWFRDWSGPLAPVARKVVVPFVKETAMVQDIYSRIDAGKEADARAAEAWAAKKQSAAKKQPTAI